MLVEIIFSCSAAGAVLGGCSDDCGTTIGSEEVVICEQQDEENEQSNEFTGSNPGSSWTPPPPWILCEIYVSGSIDIPTFGSIWVKVREGSRDCLDEKEYVPIPVAGGSSSTIEEITDTETLQEIFKTSPSSPRAHVSPSERYYDEEFNFSVDKKSQTKSGWLFDQPVSVRFIPKSASWSFGGSGFAASHVFGDKGDFRARATVRFQVDYKPTDGSWVKNAGSIQVKSNSVLVTALPLPRETRLVG